MSHEAESGLLHRAMHDDDTEESEGTGGNGAGSEVCQALLPHTLAVVLALLLQTVDIKCKISAFAGG